MPDQQPAPLPPPDWAARSVPEDGGVTHERISPIRPVVERWSIDGHRPARTEVSISTVDHPGTNGWTRDTPTVQVEGGSYTLANARQLRAALDDVLTHVDSDPIQSDAATER